MRSKKKEKVNLNSKKLSELIIEGMKEKKGENIMILNLTAIKNSIADFFIICSGTNENQLDAIADAIEKKVHESIQEYPWHVEGKENKEWILLDYVNVVAHVFKKDRRSFYELEDLWGDAEITEVESESDTTPKKKKIKK